MLSKTIIGALLIIAVSGLLMAFSGRVPAATDASLQLTTEIVGQRYCTGDGDLDGVLLELRLMYRNTGTSPLILYKGSTPVHRIVLRKTANDAPEVDSSLSWYSDRPWTVDASELGERFVILRPNASFETQTKTRVFVTRDDSKAFPGSVGSGDHYLQVTIPTWFGSPELADAMQREWRAHGILWRQPMTSLPTKFTIAKQRAIVDCR